MPASPNAALLLIDFQQAVFDTPDAEEADIILDRLARLKDAARHAGLPVIMVQHEEAGTNFERDTPSWQWPPAIAPRDGEHLVAKEISGHHACRSAHPSGRDRPLRLRLCDRILHRYQRAPRRK